MVNIRGIINREKNRFMKFRSENQKRRIMAQTLELEKARAREAELAKVNAAKQAAQRDLEKIKSYNKKVAGPSKLQKFSKNLATVMDKGKEAKKKGYFKGIDFGGNKNPPGSVFDLGPKR